MLKPRDTTFMEKSRQQVIIDDFSLKGLGDRTTQKELTDRFGSNVYSQARISPGLARFGTGDISCLDEGRLGRAL
jgi:hypothetical protein